MNIYVYLITSTEYTSPSASEQRGAVFASLSLVGSFLRTWEDEDARLASGTLGLQIPQPKKARFTAFDTWRPKVGLIYILGVLPVDDRKTCMTLELRYPNPRSYGSIVCLTPKC